MTEAWELLWRRSAGRWPAWRWGFGLLLPIALLLWGISLVIAPGEPHILTIRVESQVTSERLAGASVRIGSLRYIADDQGEVRIDPLPEGTTISVSAAGHESLQRNVADSDGDELILSLSGVLVLGKLTDSISDQPVEGAEVTVIGEDDDPVASSHTDEWGNFIFKFIPEDAILAITDDVYGHSMHAIGDEREMLIRLDPPTVAGRVVDGEGEPLAGIQVSAPNATSVTGEDGRFMLTGVGQGSEVAVASAGGTTVVVVDGPDLGEMMIPLSGGSGATPEDGAG